MHEKESDTKKFKRGRRDSHGEREEKKKETKQTARNKDTYEQIERWWREEEAPADFVQVSPWYD